MIDAAFIGNFYDQNTFSNQNFSQMYSITYAASQTANQYDHIIFGDVTFVKFYRKLFLFR